MTEEQKRIGAFVRGVSYRAWQQQYGARWDAAVVSRHYDQLHRLRQQEEAERERRRRAKRGKQ